MINYGDTYLLFNGFTDRKSRPAKFQCGALLLHVRSNQSKWINQLIAKTSREFIAITEL